MNEYWEGTVAYDGAEMDLTGAILTLREETFRLDYPAVRRLRDDLTEIIYRIEAGLARILDAVEALPDDGEAQEYHAAVQAGRAELDSLRGERP